MEYAVKRQLLVRVAYLPYMVIALAIMGPLLAPGYVLTLDMIFTPHLHMPAQVSSSYLLHVAFHFLNFLLPGDVVEKLVLLSAFLLAGIGTHTLLQLLGRSPGVRVAYYPASILYMVNPFTYDRLMAGQYNVLLGYALLPWFTQCLLVAASQPSWQQALRLSAWTVLIGIVSVHTLGMAACVAAVVSIGILCKRPQMWRPLLVSLALWTAVSTLASSYWLAPVLFGHGTIAASLQSFGPAQRRAFATVDTNGNGTFLAVLGLQGFWGDVQGLYIVPADAIDWWWLWQLLLLAVIAGGLWVAYRRDRHRAVLFTVVGAIAVCIALGPLNAWLAGRLPFFAGYREPQKFVALLALAYSYYSFWMTDWVLGYCKQLWHRLLAVLLLCFLVCIYTLPLFWGGYTQLAPVMYPPDWTAANDLMNHDKRPGKVLFLPWHLYMSFTFAGRIIANPAPDFFDRPVIVSDDPEFNHAPPQFYDPLKYSIGHKLLPEAAEGEPIANELKHDGIRYVIVAKELDYRQYASLATQPGITRVQDSPTLLVYRLDK